MSNEPLGNPPPRQFTLRSLFVLIAVVALALGMIVPAIRLARDRSRQSHCVGNLKMIGLAMHNYLDRHKCFPPAYVADSHGRAMYSWQATLCPYLEAGCFGPNFRYAEPWDSAGNRVFATASLEYYLCPADLSVGSNETNYVMIVGPGMFLSGPTPTSLSDITDDRASTIMAVETTGAKIPWAAPRDLEADKITFQVNDRQTLGISSEHPGGAYCVLCDASVRFLSDSMESAAVRSMCTIRDQENAEK